MPGIVLKSLMRRHGVTVQELSARTGITQKRILEVLASRLADKNAARDWVEAIVGRDLGPI